MLEFLFIAEHYNGGIVKQTQMDTSTIDPNKSAFYDALQAPIKRFSLVGKGHIFTVDLTDGHIEVDGRVIHTQTPPAKSPLELIYYRQVQQRTVVSPDGTKGLEPILRYFIGWQTNYRGKNYKFEMGVD